MAPQKSPLHAHYTTPGTVQVAGFAVFSSQGVVNGLSVTGNRRGRHARGRKERAAMALLPAEMALFPTEIRPKADDARGQSTRNSIPRARKFDDARSAALQKTQRGPNPASHRSPGSGHMRCHPAHGRNASKMSIDHPDFMTSHRSQGEPNHPVARLPSSSAGSCGFSPARMAAGEPTAKRWPGGIMPAGK